MTKTYAIRSGLSRMSAAPAFLLLVATISGCQDRSEQPLLVDPARPVKTLVVSPPSPGTGIELPGRIQAVPPIDLAFEEIGGRIVELPIAGRVGQEVQKGELLAQIEPERFQAALRAAESTLGEAYSALELARNEQERMEKMKRINPDLVSDSMLERTGTRLEQAESRIDSLETKVHTAERQLEHSSLRAPFAAIVTRCLVKNDQEVQADEIILSLQDTSHIQLLVDAPEPVMEAARALGADGITAIAHFPGIPGKEFPIRLKETTETGDTLIGSRTMVLEMTRPKEIDLPPGTEGTLSLSGEIPGSGIGPVLVPAIAVMTDGDGKDYVWQVVPEELRVHRLDVRIGRLAGKEQIQILAGLSGGERIVTAGVMHLAEGDKVRLWEPRDSDTSW